MVYRNKTSRRPTAKYCYAICGACCSRQIIYGVHTAINKYCELWLVTNYLCFQIVSNGNYLR